MKSAEQEFSESILALKAAHDAVGGISVNESELAEALEVSKLLRSAIYATVRSYVKSRCKATGGKNGWMIIRPFKNQSGSDMVAECSMIYSTREAAIEAIGGHIALVPEYAIINISWTE